jgi:hypothetical protein
MVQSLFHKEAALLAASMPNSWRRRGKGAQNSKKIPILALKDIPPVPNTSVLIQEMS